MGDAGAGLGEAADLGVGEMDAVRAPDVVREPAELLEVLDGRAAEALAAERLLLHRLGEVRVELEPELAGECRRLGHQLARDRERGAGSDGDLDACPGTRLVERCKSLRVLEDRVELLHDRVGRQTPVGHPEIHRAARGDEPDAELPRRLELRLDQALLTVREDVVVVEDRAATGERKLGEAGAGGRVLGLGVDARPRRIELDEPLEERPLRRASAGEGLVEVVVRVHERGGDDRAGEVAALVSQGLLARAEGTEEAVLDEDPAIRVLGARVVHRDDMRVREQGFHRPLPYSSEPWRSSPLAPLKRRCA